MNLPVNKVIYGGNTLIDLSEDTVSPDKLMEGYTAHDKTGAQIVGTATGGGGATEPYIEETYNDSGNLTNVVMHGYTSIGNYAFYGCSSLALTSLPAGITSISNSAFYNCSNLALTSLPAGTTSIGNYAFSNCSNLALTSLPAGITSINDSAFSNCSNLALTSLPAGITSISNYAFYNCTGLTTITFEGTPTTIASNVFYGCANLTTINVPWAEGAVANAPWGATNVTINYNYTGA